MEYYDVKRLGLIFAIQAEIEGMKADNWSRQQNVQANAYSDEDFCAKAEELRNISLCHNEQL